MEYQTLYLCNSNGPNEVSLSSPLLLRSNQIPCPNVLNDSIGHNSNLEKPHRTN